jgi:hypothetical protein
MEQARTSLKTGHACNRIYWRPITMIRQVLLSGVAVAAMSTIAVAQTSPSMRLAPGLSSPGATAAPAQAGAQQADKNAPLFSNYKGADVLGSDGKSVASISDVIIDNQGDVHQLALAFGGVLGIGATLKADNVSSLPPLQDGKVKLDLTTASLKALPTWEEPSKQTANNNNNNVNGTMSQGRASTNINANPNTSAQSTPLPTGPAPANGMNSGGMGASSNSTNAAPGKMTAAAPAPNGGANANSGANSSYNLSTKAAPGQSANGSANANNGNSPATPPVGASPPSSASAANANGNDGNNPPAAGAVNRTMAASNMWPVSKIVGADIHKGDKTASIDDAKFTGGKLTDVIVNDGSAIGLGKGKQTIAFNQLSIAGTPADPQITLKDAGAGSAPAASPGPATSGSGSTNTGK